MKIPFTNMELNFKKQNSNMIEVQKDVFEALASTEDKFKGMRPALDPKSAVGDEAILVPITPLPMDIIFDVAHFSDTLRTIHQNIRKEIFRNGYSIKEKFAAKCRDCGKEFETPEMQCDECNSTNIREPIARQKAILREFCKRVNDNGQDILQVSEEINDDLETIDDGYMLLIKEYLWSPEGKLLKAIPVEMIRVDPRWIRLVADKQGRPGRNQNGDWAYFCPEHRGVLHHFPENQLYKCPSCGKEMLKAHFRTEAVEGVQMHYSSDEVCHKSKYNPSLTYGFSNIFAVWMKVVTLMNMDQYIKDYYTRQRPPRGLLFVSTPNLDSLEKMWKWALDMFKMNPHQIPPIGVENPNGSRGKLVEFVDFMKSPEDMQYIEMRNEYRRQIGAIYGVMPIFQADVGQSGGLNNEGLQITVTNRAIKDGQGVYNDGYYPWACEQLGATDYKIMLNPNEEQDVMAKENIFTKKIENAHKMQQMGYDITLTDEMEFEYSPIDEPVENPQQAGMMGMGAPMGAPMDAPMDGEMPPEGAENEGEPAPPEEMEQDFQMGMPIKKGWVYLKPGKSAPKGAKTREGKGGAKYYYSEEAITRTSLQDKPIEDYTEEESEAVSRWMDEDTHQYNARDLESAKKWLANKPKLRSKLGAKYYEFAVQVASAINQGYDPEEIDWYSLDSQIPLAESLASMRQGREEEEWSKSIKKGKVYLNPGEQPPKGASVQQGPRGGKFYEDRAEGEKMPEAKPQEQPAQQHPEQPKSESKPKTNLMGQGYFITPSGETIDISSDFGEGTNDHVGFLALAYENDMAAKLGITLKDQKKLKRMYETGEPTGEETEILNRMLENNARIRVFDNEISINTGKITNKVKDAVLNMAESHKLRNPTIVYENLFGDYTNMSLDEFLDYKPGQRQMFKGESVIAKMIKEISKGRRKNAKTN